MKCKYCHKPITGRYCCWKDWRSLHSPEFELAIASSLFALALIFFKGCN